MPALKNPKHESFAQAVANGSTGVQAYRSEISNGCTVKTAMEAASRILADRKVATRVEELQKLAETTLKKRLEWDKEKALSYLVEILETPIGEVTKDHRLAQEYRDTEDCSQVKLPSKADAMKQLAVMCGWNDPERHTLDVEVRLGGNA
jgi:mRNA-degrading endonuclease YafQ of YafQ-DinJ toxin-antitoxin module